MANGIIWSSNTSRSAQDPVAQLFDSGNMVVRDAVDKIKAENFSWQSFDYPGREHTFTGNEAWKELVNGSRMVLFFVEE